MTKLAILFPGQGSQYVGMGKDLCEKFNVAKKVFEEANDALGIDIQKLCFEGSLDELTKTENSQPAILTMSCAAFRVYMQEFGLIPSYMAGHSLGEYSALVCAGSIEFADAVKIVRQRGRFMQEAVAVGIGAMAAISGVDKSVIEKECLELTNEDQIVVVSNYNSPEQTVVSGHKQAIETLGKKFTEMGARVMPLKVSAPFHSPLMQPAADNLRSELLKYTYKELTYPVISNVSALPYTNVESIVDNLFMQIVQPVRWVESMDYLQEQGVTMAIEMGPQTVLRNLMKKNAPSIETFSYDREEDVAALQKQLVKSGHAPENQKGNIMELIIKCMAVAVCTKNRNWDNNEYQKGVVEPYRRIKEMQAKLEEKGKEPLPEQAEEALNMLKSVFVTKRTPLEEQVERFNHILGTTGTKDLFLHKYI